MRAKLRNANNNKHLRFDNDYTHAIEKNFYIDRSKAELYVCSIEANGAITAKQVVSFTQHDLTSENIYLLDARLFVYVWIGSQRFEHFCLILSCVDIRKFLLIILLYSCSPKSEKVRCWQMLDEYLANYPVPRDISTPQAVIYQGLEPSTFIGYFDQWDKKFWDVGIHRRETIMSTDMNLVYLCFAQITEGIYFR